MLRVNYGHELNQGLLGWWLSLPGIDHGRRFANILQPFSSILSGSHGIFVSTLAESPSSGMTGTKRPGGMGQWNFDGSASNYLDFGNHWHIQPGREWSFALWVNWVSFFSDAGGHAPLSHSNSSNDGFALLQGTSAPFNIIRLVAAPGGSATGVNSAQINTGQWYHVVGTYDGSRIRLYVDGGLSGSATATGAMSYANNMYAGETYAPGTNQFIGAIDDIRVYSRVLSASEVSLLRAKSMQFYPGVLRLVPTPAGLIVTPPGTTSAASRFFFAA